MKEFCVEFSGQFTAMFRVKAENEEEAREVAGDLFDDVPTPRISFETSDVSVWQTQPLKKLGE